MPRLGIVAEQTEFGRQGALAGAELCIDAGGIGFEGLAQGRARGPELRLGRAVEAEDAHAPVDGEDIRPDHLGQAAGTEAAHRIHLEQPILGVEKAEGEVGVVARGGGDAGHAPIITANGDRGLQSRYLQFARFLRQAAAQIEEPGTPRQASQPDQPQDADKASAQPAAHSCHSSPCRT